MGTSATVGRLTVAVEADVSTLAPSLNQGAQSVRNFAETTDRSAVSVQELAQAIKALTGSAATVNPAGQLVVSSARDFELATGMVRNFGAAVEVVRGDLQREAQAAAGAGIAVQKAAQQQVDAIERVTATTQAASRATQGAATNAFGFTAAGQRAANAALAMSFGFDAVARSGDNSGAAIQQVLRAASNMALIFGPEGLVVGAVTSAGLAIFEVFDKSRRELEKTAKAFTDGLNKMIDAADTVGLQQQLQGLERGAASSGLAKFSADARDFAGGLNDLRAQVAQLNADVQRHPADFIGVAAVNQLKQLGPLLAEREAQATRLREAILNPTTARTSSGLPGITVSAESDARADRLGLKQDAKDAAAATKEVERLARATEQLRRAGITNVVRSTPSLRQSEAPTDVTVQALAQTRSGFLDATTAASAFGGEVERAADAALRLVDSVGFLPAAFRDAVSAIAGIGAGIRQGASALENLKAAKGAGDAVSAVAGLAGAAGSIVGALGALGSLFTGVSEAEREQTAILRSNNDRLDAIRLSLDRSPVGGAGLASAGALAARIAFDPAFRTTVARSPLLGGGFETTNFVDAAKLSASDLSNLKRAAAQEGINLFDAAGHLLAASVNQLAQAIGANADNLTRLDEDFASRLAQSDLDAKLRGGDTGGTAGDLTRGFDVFASVAPALAKRFFADITDATLGTASGQAAYRRDLIALNDAIKAGAISLTDLGGLGDIKELIPFLGTAADGLNALGKATNEATAAMLNVPTGFRLALRTFDAQVATQLSGASGGSAFPVSAGFPSSASAAAPSTTTNSVSVTVQLTSTAPNAPQLARELGDVFVQKGAALGAPGVPLVNLGRALRA